MIKSICSRAHLGARSLMAPSLVLLVFVFLGALFAIPSSAQRIEMMKIVYRLTGPSILPDSAITKPITIYKAGEKYLRVEYPPDPVKGKQGLHITKEPDIWSINLADHTAQHMLDPDPEFIARNPIIWMPKPPGKPDPDEFFSDLQFGNEAAFFRHRHTRDVGWRKIEGKDAKGFALKNGAREVTLFLDPETEKPVQMDVVKDEKLEISVHYITYEGHLPFDPALFEPPKDLKITEAK